MWSAAGRYTSNMWPVGTRSIEFALAGIKVWLRSRTMNLRLQKVWQTNAHISCYHCFFTLLHPAKIEATLTDLLKHYKLRQLIDPFYIKPDPPERVVAPPNLEEVSSL